ncbi:transcriptional regulator [Desulfovibrio sp. OttesenSCG-928-C06]|nr:transcriptional regulator [Desulfovibrio sp. OttesenSCG-928-C06]
MNNTSGRFPSLTAVLHHSVLNAPSGLDAKTIAELVGKPYQTFMSELSRQQGHKLGADMVLPVISVSGSFLGVNFIARQMGGVFVPLPDPALSSSDAVLAHALADSMREFGEFAAETAASISDGDIPLDQLESIDKEADEAIVAIQTMKKLSRARHEKLYGRAAQ